MAIRIKKSNIRYLILLLILCMEHQLLYLVPASWKVFGLDYQGICFLAEVMVFMESLAETNFRLRKSKYNWIFYIGLMLVVTSAVAGMVTYGQSFSTGLIVQRTRIGSLIFFFALLQWYSNKKITADGIWKTLIVFAILYASLCSIQYILANVVTFTYSTSSEKMRYGSVRYWFNGTYLVFLAGYGLDKFWKKGNHKGIYAFLMIFPFVLFYIITKSRMAALALTCSFLICVIIKDGLSTKRFFSIAIVIVAFLFLSSTSVGMDLMNTLLNGSTGAEDTLSVRTIGRAYYISETAKTPIRFLLGCGYASANNSTALEMAYPQVYSTIYGYSVSLYPQDNGVIGSFYYYGFLGILWWACVILCVTIKGWKIYKRTGRTVFLGFVMYEVISCITLTPTEFGRYIMTAIVVLLLLATEDASLTRSE